MRADLRFVSVALFCAMLLARVVHAQVDNLQPSPPIARPKHSQAPRGVIAVDVTVRTLPRLAAPGIKDLPAGTSVRSVPSRALGWTRIVEPVRGWIPSETYAIRGDDAEKAATVSPAALGLRPPASGLVASAPAEGRPPRAERSESELMLEALTATRGESPNAARIARVVAETTKEVRRKRINEPLATFWKDPFVDDSEPPALVRSRHGRRGGARAMPGAAEDRAEAPPVEGELSARREAARARAETAAGRAQAAPAQADAVAAKREAAAARAALDERPERRHRAVERGVPWRELALHVDNRTERVRKAPRRESPSVVGKRASRSAGGVATTAGDESPANDAMEPRVPLVSVPAAPPEAPPPDVPPQPSSAGYHGILVVPLN